MENGLNLKRYNLDINEFCKNSNVIEKDKCDKYDYLVSASSGMIAGLIDAFFVGSPLSGPIGSFSDGVIDGVVMKFAKQMGWDSQDGTKGIASAIGFLERRFKVNYDQAHSGAIGNAFNMAARNHHIKSLGHSPSIVGLFFSIIDQFNGTSHFINNGKVISIDTSVQDLTIYGTSFHSKLFCGFVNWLGHIMSDIGGSSGARGNGNRGSGLVIPFMELFQLCNFGTFKNGQQRLDFANTMVKVFENGYDFRHGLAMAIPVVLNELFIKVFWVIKRKFYKGYDWKDCVPTSNHDDLRLMLLIGNAMLCVIDGLDACIRSGGNIVLFILRLNLIAWARLILLIFKELRVRFGDVILSLVKDFIKQVQQWGESYKVESFYNRINAFNTNLKEALMIFIDEVERETKYIVETVNFLRDDRNDDEKKFQKTIELAKHCNVDDKKIIKNNSDLDDYFL